MTGTARDSVPPALRCRCVCAMTHAMPGREPSVVCAGRIVVFVEMSNSAQLGGAGRADVSAVRGLCRASARIRPDQGDSMPNDRRHADAEYWQLTSAERFGYFGRLARYHGRRTDHYGEEAARLGLVSRRRLVVSVCWAAAAVLLAVVGLVGWLAGMMQS